MIEDIFNAIFQMWNIYRVAILGTLLMAFIVIGIIWYKKKNISTNMKVLYLSEVEKLCSLLDVINLSSKSIYTKDNKRFYRRSPAYTFLLGSQKLILWFAKRGKGYTFKLEDTTEKDEKTGEFIQKAENLGNIYDGIEKALGIEILEGKFTDEEIKTMRDSNIYLAVNIESDDMSIPDITEDGVISEANNDMAELIGINIKNKILREDWIKNAGLIGIGVAITFVAQTMGIF